MIFLVLLLALISPGLIHADEPIVKITNFSSNSLPEWVEINNQTTNPIDLSGWYFKDNADHIFSISGCLSANSYTTFYKDSYWLNDSGDSIILYNSSNQIIDQLVYTEGKLATNPQNTNTCSPTPIPSATPSPTPLPTNTPAPTSTSAPLPTITPSATPTPTPGPTTTPTKTPTLTPKPSNTPYPTVSPAPLETPINEPLPSDYQQQPVSNSDTLGIQDIIKPTPHPSPKTPVKFPTQILPILFIGLGGLLLLSPLVIAKIKK